MRVQHFLRVAASSFMPRCCRLGMTSGLLESEETTDILASK